MSKFKLIPLFLDRSQMQYFGTVVPLSHELSSHDKAHDLASCDNIYRSLLNKCSPVTHMSCLLVIAYELYPFNTRVICLSNELYTVNSL